MAPLPSITPSQLRMLRLVALPRPGQLDWAMAPGAVRQCPVHDADAWDFLHDVRPLWAAQEVVIAGGPSCPQVDTVKDHLDRLADCGAVEGPITVSCHCTDEGFRDLDWKAAGRAKNVGKSVSQGYYRLTDVGVSILAAHSPTESETPMPRKGPGRSPV